MNKRLAFLEQALCGAGRRFVRVLRPRHGPYRKEGRVDDAVATFSKLKDKDPAYVPLYLMAGQTLIDAGRGAEARTWLEAGITAATQKHDTHALGELESALASL